MYPDSQSHKTNNFIPNLWRLEGINCLKHKRPFHSTMLSSIHSFWPGENEPLNFFLSVSITGLIL